MRGAIAKPPTALISRRSSMMPAVPCWSQMARRMERKALAQLAPHGKKATSCQQHKQREISFPLLLKAPEVGNWLVAPEGDFKLIPSLETDGNRPQASHDAFRHPQSQRLRDLASVKGGGTRKARLQLLKPAVRSGAGGDTDISAACKHLILPNTE